LPALTDEAMVNELRVNLFDAAAPNPSVETLLHAFLPHRYVDHTHADIALVLTNQPAGEAEALAREAFGPRWGIVPYAMPGLALAKLSAEVFEKDPTVEGLVLLNHGLFTFADDARTSYERMIEAVNRAERFVEARAKEAGRSVVQVAARTGGADQPDEGVAKLAPILRGALAEPGADGRPVRMLLEARSGEEVLGALARSDAALLAARGPLTPDHVIRTKGPALFLEGPLPLSDEGALRDRVTRAVAAYREQYNRYFEENKGRARGSVTKLDATPRVVLAPGIGVIAAGRSKAAARIAADIAEHTVTAKAIANSIGRYTALSEGDLFEMEYWSLEQAKLGKAKEPPLAGQAALVTGAAGAIGFGIAKQLIAAGAHVLVSDVTDEASVARGFTEASRLYGGVDILVLNAGVAHVSSIEGLEAEAFKKVADVNLVGSFLVLREGARLFRRQGTGGNIIINSSKNVFSPGAEFGAYSASKAGAHQLGKVAALELAAIGVRVNMINADAVFGDERRPSGLWQEVGPSRARSKGLDPSSLKEHYQKRNLLKAAITAEHVGNAVVFFATDQTPTTGATLPVDGGIPEAFPR
jgi:rhamnose utilization protein RhaD (predicted bifunctional aldolase and dehydrogenase)/NAD(P)-dependent dehydrogenase (short-subunit alcohol dehydrogenase family)